MEVFGNKNKNFSIKSSYSEDLRKVKTLAKLAFGNSGKKMFHILRIDSIEVVIGESYVSARFYECGKHIEIGDGFSIDILSGQKNPERNIIFTILTFKNCIIYNMLCCIIQNLAQLIEN